MSSPSSSSSSTPQQDIPGVCPTPIEMGHSGWNILHGAGAVYPYAPSDAQREAMRQFIHGFSYTYPCNWCAYHMRLYLQQHPPDVRDKLTVTRFFCELHNNVNEHLGKPLYECDTDKLLRRWHPGYPDKMADKPSMEERVAAEQRRMAAEAAAAVSSNKDSAASSSLSSVSQSRAAMQWRSSNVTALHNSNNDSGKASSAVVDDDSGRRGQRSWWSSMWSTADRKADVTAAARVADGQSGSRTHDSATAPVSRKVSDGETNIAKVLERLKGCMVYCPEDEQGKKK